jgi:lysozyme
MQDLIRDEGKKSKPYKDTAGFLTIGIGHNLDQEGLCEEAIQAQFAYDLKTKAIDPLDRYLPWHAGHPENIQRALANLMFNMGPGSLLQFKVFLSLIQKGHYKEAAEDLMNTKYATQVPRRAASIAELIKHG